MPDVPDRGAFRFVRSQAGLYLGADSGGAFPNQRLAYLPPATETGLAPALTLEQSWQAGGAYAFLGTSLNSGQVFIPTFRRWLTVEPYGNSRVVWIANPNDPLSAWRVWAIPVIAGKVSSRTPVDFRNYALIFGPGCGVGADNASASLVFTAGTAPASITLGSADGTTQVPVVTGPVSIPLFSSDDWGSFAFRAEFALNDQGTEHLDAMDCGLRYFYPTPAIPGTFSSLRHRVFDLAAGQGTSVALDATIDPMRPLDTDRTQFLFAGGAPQLGSFYRTNLSAPMALTPSTTPKPSRLIFALRPRTANPGSGDPMYLVPDGSFAFGPGHGVPNDPVPELLCGISGPEYVKTVPKMTLTFVAGQPAFAPVFDPNQQEQPKPTEAPRLTAAATTAWASLTAEDEQPEYYAQPHGAYLFGHQDQGQANSNGTNPYLPYFPVQAGTLPKTGESANADPALTSYPLAPYAGATSGLTALSRMEVQVLSQERRAIVYDISKKVAKQPVFSAAAPEAETAVCKAGTPQGLIAEFQADGQGGCDSTVWKHLKLALSADTTLLALDGIQDPLRSALLTPQQFFVASNPAAMASHIGANNAIHIEDWKFLFATDDWSRHGTVMIIKHVPKTLRELVADSSTWILADQFNSNVAATQAQLQEIVANIPADSDFDNFRKIVDDPNWNGILFFNAFVPLKSLPPQLEGLAAGIDPSLFKAHHIGINQTAVSPDLVQQKSSLFGLIYYTKTAQLSTTTFDFNVLSLKVLFRNSGIAAFSSEIQVALNTLFATEVTQLKAESNVIKLQGVYQKHGDTHAYVFSETRPTVFDANDDEVLASVTINKATFATLVGTEAETSDQVQTRFSFWGSMAFVEQQVPAGDGKTMPCDLFSYDALAFSNLLLHMDFARAQPSDRTFTFDAAKMAFDASTSITREHALARHFPMSIKRMLTAGEGSKSIADLGYMTLSTQLDSSQPSGTWFALDFDLNLGTLGAYASNAGLVVSIALAWSPSSYGLKVFAGLKLPMSSGAKNEISIEGVIKITMYARQLFYNDKAFIMKLTGIALKLLGKQLPPGGAFDFYIFGDPDPAAGANSLGWYGAWIKDKPKTSPDDDPIGAKEPPITIGGGN
ncbi:MAG: hypothetical protein QNJ16_00830 [Rhodobacter sp.]|nr:hypothetical protein [Rhodobacter sp.]